MKNRIGVYIHIPFCVSKCAYCNFYSVAGKDKLMDEYRNSVIKHISEYAGQLKGYYIDTIYFGGGTPSHFGADRLIAVLDALKRTGTVLLDSEITAEMNPESIRKSDLRKMRKAGFNRISIGMQSANDNMLTNIGRRHNVARVEEAVRDAREAGFRNISLDLMYGLPSQTKEDWSLTLAKAVSLKPDHISCYGLKLEEGTPLYIFHDSPFMPDDDAQADMYLYAVDFLSQFGLKQYEVSNFARRGYESKHNMKYWRCEEYIGFGPAAHSYVGGWRYSNIADLENYCGNIDRDLPVVENREYIGYNERISEYIMLAMRTVQGINREEFSQFRDGSYEKLVERLETYKENGWADTDGDRWFFTPKGFLVSNILIGDLIDVHTRYRADENKKMNPNAPDIVIEKNDVSKTATSSFKGL